MTIHFISCIWPSQVCINLLSIFWYSELRCIENLQKHGTHNSVMSPQAQHMAKHNVNLTFRTSPTAPVVHPNNYGPLTRYVILPVAHAPGMLGTFSPPPRVSDPGMRHGASVTHVLWCIPGSLNSGFLWSRWRENVPGIPGSCVIHNFAVSGKRPMAYILLGYAAVYVRVALTMSISITSLFPGTLVIIQRNSDTEWFLMYTLPYKTTIILGTCSTCLIVIMVLLTFSAD